MADQPPAACGHKFQVSTWTASDDRWVSAALRPDYLSPWSPARPETDSADRDVVVVHANADEVRRCEHCRWHFSSTFEMPEFWWSKHTRDSNGYYGCDSRRDEDGVMTGFNTWCRFIVKMLQSDGKYAWAKFNIYTQWKARTHQTAVLVFDLYKNYKDKDFSLSFEDALFYGPGQRHLGVREKHSPLWPYTRILNELGKLQDKSVWDIRTKVRDVEKAREAKEQMDSERKRPQINYPELHDLARHAIHVCETLDVAVRTGKTILEHHARFMDELAQGGLDMALDDRSMRVAAGAARNVHEKLQHMEHMLESLRQRSSSNKARLLNEIQLCFHMSAEYDSTVSVQIASATRSDSADMRTVAYLTLTFLPATFISALFGTSFFSFEQDTGTWAMSDKFWIFWAISLPATALTVGVWYAWKTRMPQALGRRGTGLEAVRSSRDIKGKIKDLMEMDWMKNGEV